MVCNTWLKPVKKKIETIPKQKNETAQLCNNLRSFVFDSMISKNCRASVLLARLLPFTGAIFSVWQKCGMLAERKKKSTETQQCAEFRCFVLVTRTGIEPMLQP